VKAFEIVLLHPSARMAVRLPPLALAPDQISDAGFLIQGVRAAHGVESVVLKRLGARRGADRRFETYRYALAALSPELPAGLTWAAGPDAEGALQQAEAVRADQPWASPGWWPEMHRWIGAACAQAGLSQMARLTQVRAWDLSSVVEAQLRSGEILYYKAVPRAFGSEPGLTAWLESLAADAGSSGRGPRVVAVDPEHRGMLLRACEGERLDAVTDLASWERALCDYAALQQTCAPYVDQLAARGLPRRSLEWLPGAWERLLADERCLQPGGHNDLTDAEIASLRTAGAARMSDWKETLGGLQVPDTLEHGDFHALNAFVDATGTRVIDWTDASIAHPFFSLACFLRSQPHGPELSGRLAAAYLSCWTTHAPRAALIASVPAVMGLGAVFQAVHYRERIRPLIDTYQEIRSAIPGYAREILQRKY